MKSNKNSILNYIKNHTEQTEFSDHLDFSTQEISDIFGLQRSNASALLNQLVSESILEKTNSRPVRYALKLSQTNDENTFSKFIGHKESLRNSVQLASAAVLYPPHLLNVFITGDPGTGKSYFSRLIYLYAIEQKRLKKNAPFILVNGNQYSDDAHLINDEISELFHKAKNGVICFSHMDKMSFHNQSVLNDLIDLHQYQFEGKTQNIDCLIIINSDVPVTSQAIEHLEHRFPIIINLPKLSERTMNERLSLVLAFLKEESKLMGRSIEVEYDVLSSLLIYDCPRNIKQLRSDIRLACANAYVKHVNSLSELKLELKDFDLSVQKGVLRQAEFQFDLDKLISKDIHYIFNESMMIEDRDQNEFVPHNNLYDEINTKIKELKDRGIDLSSNQDLVKFELENIFNQYKSKLAQQAINKDELSKFVSLRLINSVEAFLNEASIKFDKIYPPSVFYSLCLHVNAVISDSARNIVFSKEQIERIVENNKKEYVFCLRYASQLEEMFKIKLAIDEVVFISMFISGKLETESERHSSVLIIMHGVGAAKSIAETVNKLTSNNSVYSFDMPLESSAQDAYKQLKDMILSMNRSDGIVIIYDMGSIKTMCETISLELNIKIRLINMPITLIALEASRKASMGLNVDTISSQLDESLRNYMDNQSQTRAIMHKNDVIVTLCNTGVGGATQLMNYIKQNEKLKEIKIIPLAQSDRLNLINEIQNIQEEHTIRWVIGSYDPNLSISYMPISKVFETEINELPKLFNLEIKYEKIDYSKIYAYLSDELKFVDIQKIKRYLPDLIEDIRKNIKHNLNADQELGLFMHIASSLNRMLGKEKEPQNVQKVMIIKKYAFEFRELLKLLKPIEKNFNVIFSDDEIAFLITIIKQI